ncbi:MAG TPA: type II toxin-antitoxin system VapC family toxin [Candidatus Acidoferrum sp.]|nr:type II toxin-antitoxin system VapC family toxin [Candidatus Acidoferrum sp.]
MTLIVIDSSALLAIFLNEPERAPFIDLILSADKRLLSAATLVEAAVVLESRTSLIVVRELDLFLHESGIEVVSVDSTQADRARMAFRKFGKKRHPAALNFGDCFTHALAVVSGEPVLAKGNEFRLVGLAACT